MPPRLQPEIYTKITFFSQPHTDADPPRDNASEDDGEAPLCGECGRTLGPGWFCESCRRACPYCNRALSSDPNDYCTRCHRKCDRHNIVYPLVSLQPNNQTGQCPECANDNIRI